MLLVDYRFWICLARRVAIVFVALVFAAATNISSTMAMHTTHQQTHSEELVHSSSFGLANTHESAAPSRSDDRSGCKDNQVSARCIGSTCFSCDMLSAIVPSPVMNASMLLLKAGVNDFGVHMETPPPVRPPKNV
ncbi:hypothetical protein [Ruegeria sediminis]|uniref:hypothetical protein n=1 Tax=Ruegeria sediminis TaxID=2583820 RepID=UPI001C558A08|nr:hypothetical protein [Ruegeria sediminis]